MTIHDQHPFLDPEPDPARRLRARLGGQVSLWTSGALGAGPAGLTVSSLLVATGEPAYVVGLLDPDSDLVEALQRTGSAVVHLLQWQDRGLAEEFAGLSPAPGGPFSRAAFVDTAWGPRLERAATWAGVRLHDTRPLGWSTEVTCVLEHLVVGEDGSPLLHRRGRYVRPDGDQPPSGGRGRNGAAT